MNTEQEVKKQEVKASKSKKPDGAQTLALIRIKGEIGLNQEINDTFNMLNLRKKHSCVLLPKTAVNIGMARKLNPFITWGEASEEIISLLKSKYKDVKVFHLSPPRGGFERKGLKIPYNVGGAHGYRSKDINDLIKRMCN